MGRGNQLARQWRIIQTLISSKQGKSVGDLVKDENCHPRTIHRDLEALQEAGFPIYEERRDGGPFASSLGKSELVRKAVCF
jgi:predicted DNA-binding transcriptional regulator YafY